MGTDHLEINKSSRKYNYEFKKCILIQSSEETRTCATLFALASLHVPHIKRTHVFANQKLTCNFSIFSKWPVHMFGTKLA